MNPHTMTLDELRDWCAGDDGWKLVFRHRYANGVEEWWWERGGGDESFDDPYPPTLDGADSAVPKGYYWERAMGAWNAYPSSVAPNEIAEPFVVVPDTGDKIRDLFALAVLCRIAGKGEGK